MAINMVNTGSRAEQLTKGITNMVIKRSFQLSIDRVAIIAGMAQAMPEIRGTTLLPFRPNCRMSLSIRNTTRAIYPVSSNMAIKRKRSMIWGTNIRIPPIPGKMPSVINENKGPSGNLFFKDKLRLLIDVSIKSIGYSAHAKMD
jgi:hypothetical protein